MTLQEKVAKANSLTESAARIRVLSKYVNTTTQRIEDLQRADSLDKQAKELLEGI